MPSPPQAPVTPEQARELVVREDDTVCTAMVKLLQISVAAWKLVKFKYTPDGVLTPEYRTMLCAAPDCPSPEEDGSSTSSNPPI